jgi:hypothetical protein
VGPSQLLLLMLLHASLPYPILDQLEAKCYMQLALELIAPPPLQIHRGGAANSKRQQQQHMHLQLHRSVITAPFIRRRRGQ